MKQIQTYIFMFLASITAFQSTFAAAPIINCGELPWCNGDSRVSESNVYAIIGGVIAKMIQYVAVIAVIAIMVWGIMYLLSSGEEEKIQKAKNVIIWALGWVFVSVAAWSLISILNNFRL